MEWDVDDNLNNRFDSWGKNLSPFLFFCRKVLLYQISGTDSTLSADKWYDGPLHFAPAQPFFLTLLLLSCFGKHVDAGVTPIHRITRMRSDLRGCFHAPYWGRRGTTLKILKHKQEPRTLWAREISKARNEVLFDAKSHSAGFFVWADDQLVSHPASPPPPTNLVRQE